MHSGNCWLALLPVESAMFWSAPCNNLSEQPWNLLYFPLLSHPFAFRVSILCSCDLCLCCVTSASPDPKCQPPRDTSLREMSLNSQLFLATSLASSSPNLCHFQEVSSTLLLTEYWGIGIFLTAPDLSIHMCACMHMYTCTLLICPFLIILISNLRCWRLNPMYNVLFWRSGCLDGTH